MILEMIKAVAGMLLLMGLWLAVQAYLRKRYALHPGADVLEDMTHGCGNCDHAASCGGGAAACHQGERHHVSE